MHETLEHIPTGHQKVLDDEGVRPLSLEELAALEVAERTLDEHNIATDIREGERNPNPEGRIVYAGGLSSTAAQRERAEKMYADEQARLEALGVRPSTPEEQLARTERMLRYHRLGGTAMPGDGLQTAVGMAERHEPTPADDIRERRVGLLGRVGNRYRRQMYKGRHRS